MSAWNKTTDWAAYLDRHTMPEPNSGCWLWLGTVTNLGYGVTAQMGSINRAHRLSWSIHRGTIPAKMAVLHKCDVRCCANPDHLFLGTQTDNMRDMARKGRGKSTPLPGSRNPMAALTDDTARYAIERYRAKACSQRDLAAELGVTVMTINRCVRGLSWKHLQN